VRLFQGSFGCSNECFWQIKVTVPVIACLCLTNVLKQGFISFNNRGNDMEQEKL